MIKIAHLGAYGKNIGDNIALYNIRKYIDQKTSMPLQWTSVELADFHERANEPAYCKRRMKEISDSHDILIIGGGGLIQQQSTRFHNEFNLPFYEEIYNVIDIPIVCCSVGYNTFRKITTEKAPDKQVTHVRIDDQETTISETFLINLLMLIEKSAFFSFRNDGSVESITRIFEGYFRTRAPAYKAIPKHLYVTPDPGMIFDKEAERKTSLKDANGVLEVAFNGNLKIMNGRFPANALNMYILDEIREEKDLKIFPHCNKDYFFIKKPASLWPQPSEDHIHRACAPEKYRRYLTQGTFVEEDFIYTEEDFLKNLDFNNFHKIIERYFEYDYSIAMRGHGQIIAMGLNIPHISLSTQKKVYDFAHMNGFGEYILDTAYDLSPEDNYLQKYKENLLKMINRFESDEKYLLDWYNKRDKFVAECRSSFFRMRDHVVQIIENLK